MVYGNQSDVSQNTTFAPLANVTVNGCLDIEEINDRLKAQRNPDLYFHFWPAPPGDLTVYDLHPGECFVIQKGFNNVRADGLIKGFSSFNGICLLKAAIYSAAGLPSKPDDADILAKKEDIVKAANKMLKDKYQFIGVSATRSHMTPDKNFQTQKPAIYVAGVIDLVHNNFTETRPIQVGNRICVKFPEIVWDASKQTLVGKKYTNQDYLRESGRQHEKTMCIIYTSERRNIWEKEYFKNMVTTLLVKWKADLAGKSDDQIKNIVEENFNGNTDIVKQIMWPFREELLHDMSNQLGIAYSNAKPGQKFNTLLSHKTIA
jgi:hypothetical protein